VLREARQAETKQKISKIGLIWMKGTLDFSFLSCLLGKELIKNAFSASTGSTKVSKDTSKQPTFSVETI
jgi:hypothetical protein